MVSEWFYEDRLDELQSRRDESMALDTATPTELDALSDLLPDALTRYRDRITKLNMLPEDAIPAQTTRFKADLSDLRPISG
jgi:hypothetical protein